MSDFWQAPGNGVVINLDQVVSVDRPVDGKGLRVITAVRGVTLTVDDDAVPALLKAIGERIAERMKGRAP